MEIRLARRELWVTIPALFPAVGYCLTLSGVVVALASLETTSTMRCELASAVGTVQYGTGTVTPTRSAKKSETVTGILG